MSAGEPIGRMLGTIKKFKVEVVLVGLLVAMAVSIAVALANVLLLPLRVYLTGVATASVIDECRIRDLTFGRTAYIAYFVRTRASSDFIPIARCDPKVTGENVSVIVSEIAGKSVAVKGRLTLVRIYLALSGPAGVAFIFALVLACWLTLYRARRILGFALAEFRKAWVRVILAQDRWESRIKASEVLTDFLFMGLIVVATGLVVYAMFRTTLYIQGTTWFSVFAISTLAIIWSPIPLKMITLAWKAYTSPLFQILRNLVAGLLMFGAIRTICKMPQAADFTSVHGLLTFVLAVLKASIGL